MAAHPRHSAPPAGENALLSGLHLALEGLAQAMTQTVNAVITEHVGHKAAAKAAEKRVAELMPELLEQQFALSFLQDQDAARRRRALLTHLLSAADLHGVRGMPFKAPLVPVPAAGAAEDADEITSEAAAKLLHVSRTHLNSLVDSGQLGPVRRTAGGHRRISKASVLRYKAASKARQAKGLQAMGEASQRLGLYDHELDGVPVRARR